MCFFSCHRIISHDRIYVERMFWGPPDRFSSPTEKNIAKTIIRICPFRQILSCSNLPTSSVELIWPITELYFRQILSTDFMNRFCQDVKTGPYGLPPEFRGGVHFILNRHTPSGQSRVYRVAQLRTDGVHCRESAGTGPVNLKVVPNECCLGRSTWTN